MHHKINCKRHSDNMQCFFWQYYLLYYFALYNAKENMVMWSHDMETLSTLLAFCEGNQLSAHDSPHKGPVT